MSAERHGRTYEIRQLSNRTDCMCACIFALTYTLSSPVYWQLCLENVTASKWTPDAKLPHISAVAGNSVGDNLPNIEYCRHDAVNGFR